MMACLWNTAINLPSYYIIYIHNIQTANTLVHTALLVMQRQPEDIVAYEETLSNLLQVEHLTEPKNMVIIGLQGEI